MVLLLGTIGNVHIPALAMDKDSTVGKVNRWVKAAWIIGWITGIIWALFSSYLVVLSTHEIFIFDPTLTFSTFLCTIKYAPVWNQPLSDTIYYCLFDSAREYLILRAISNGLLVAGLTYGVIRKNRVCAIILLLLPFLNYVLSIALGGFSPGYGPHGLVLAVTFVIYSSFSLLLLIGVLGTFFYHRAIKAA